VDVGQPRSCGPTRSSPARAAAGAWPPCVRARGAPRGSRPASRAMPRPSSPPHHEHLPRRNLRGVAVRAAVQLEQRGAGPLRLQGQVGPLEGPRRADDVARLEERVRRVDLIGAADFAHRAHPRPEAHGEVERLHITGEVVSHLVLGGERPGVPWEGHSGQVVVRAGREEPERVPPRPPGVAHLARCIEDEELPPLAGEVIAEGEAALASADDDDVVHGSLRYRRSARARDIRSTAARASTPEEVRRE
jgi:hypothetical protein